MKGCSPLHTTLRLLCRPARAVHFSSGAPRGLHKPVVVKGPLALFLGKQESSFVDIQRALWKHIKEHQLQKPSDKRNIVCDAKLRSIMQKDEVNMLEMAGIIQQYIDKTPSTKPAS
eukprot:GHVS01075022.1.p1 GENE.GHVS01075022.1~~GHVS01075022.1.p1  ORF type:complete len:116 (-),score=16.87 GHVS01075022.1:195-542(-)